MPALDSNGRMRIGVDLGGTKIEVLALGASGEQLARRRVATPQGDYRASVEAVAGLVRWAEAETGMPGSVGVGIPGSLSPRDGRIRNANSTCLNGQPLQADLEAALGRPVRLANDANCLAMSEATDGAGAGCAVVFAVVLGTGVGAGIVANGRLLAGANGIAGEWGHWPLALPQAEDLPPPECWCGRPGCVETYLSGPALAADHRRHGGALKDAQAIAAGASEGDGACAASLARYERRLARALAQVINLLDPDVIVLGGGLSRLERLYRNVPQLWLRHVFSDLCTTPLRPALHGDSSGVRGAAWLWGRDE